MQHCLSRFLTLRLQHCLRILLKVIQHRLRFLTLRLQYRISLLLKVIQHRLLRFLTLRRLRFLTLRLRLIILLKVIQCRLRILTLRRLRFLTLRLRLIILLKVIQCRLRILPLQLTLGSAQWIVTVQLQLVMQQTIEPYQLFFNRSWFPPRKT
jgi:hypothetical protein